MTIRTLSIDSFTRLSPSPKLLFTPELLAAELRRRGHDVQLKDLRCYSITELETLLTRENRVLPDEVETAISNCMEEIFKYTEAVVDLRAIPILAACGLARKEAIIITQYPLSLMKSAINDAVAILRARQGRDAAPMIADINLIHAGRDSNFHGIVDDSVDTNDSTPRTSFKQARECWGDLALSINSAPIIQDLIDATRSSIDRIEFLRSKREFSHNEMQELVDYLGGTHLTNRESRGFYDHDTGERNMLALKASRRSAASINMVLQVMSADAALIEITLRDWLITKRGFSFELNQRKTLGNIIDTAKRSGIPRQVVDRLKEFNDLRNIAIHNLALGKMPYLSLCEEYVKVSDTLDLLQMWTQMDQRLRA